MRLAPLALMLMLVGCVDVADVEGASVDPAPAPAPFADEGIVFLAPTFSDERVETLLPVPVEASSSAIVASLRLGSRYMGVETPPFPSDVLVELRAPDGTVLAEGRLDARAPEAQIEAIADTAGEHLLALLSYGGSDEQANGDYVEWRIGVTPPARATS